MAGKQSEVVLEIGCEGGGYTILSRVTSDGRVFRLSSDSLDLDSNDEENWTSHQEAWRSSIDDVFADLNPIWYRLYPIMVHPDFASVIWQRYVTACQEVKEGSPKLIPAWTGLLLGRSFGKLEDAIAFFSGTPAVSNTTTVTQSLPAHWLAFSERLQDALSKMEEDQFLVLSIKEINRYIQFAAQGAGGMRAEATSNHYLSGRERLNEHETRALIKLGWRPPTGSPDEATPERDPSGSSNFFVDLANPIDFAQLVVLAIRTLSEVFGAPYEGLLQYAAYDYGGSSFALPDLQIKRECRDPALKMSVLADRLLDVLRDATGLTDLEFDSDGDVNIPARGMRFGICLLGQPPMVRFFSPMLEEVRSSRKLLEELNHLNLKGGPTRYILHRNTVIAVLDIPAWPLQADHVVASLERFVSATPSASAWLEAKLQSKTGSHTQIH